MTALWKASLFRLIFVIAALLAIFHREVAQMAAIWWNISTYSHCLFILPIVGWLIWQRRDEVLRLTPSAWWPGIALIFGGALIWMLGEAGGIALLRHAGLVFMIQASVAALLGFDLARGLLFPLFYLIFLIPFGDELVPLFQTITAELTIFFLHIAQIPATMDGVFITTPTGLFEVAEACSGVKFLVAMVAYGALVANVCFKSWRRRAAFMAVAVIVPIIANGLRAYGTIHVSYITGNTDFAESFDHIVFGWVFFAVVMIVVMAIGWKFFDRKLDDRWLSDWQQSQPKPSRWPVAAVALAAALLPVGWQAAMASRGQIAAPHQISLPEVPGWRRADVVQNHPWQPRFDGADHRLFGQYEGEKGQRVDLYLALYTAQQEGREIVGYAQGAFDPETSWSWSRDAAPPPRGQAVRIVAPGVEREVVSFYRIDGLTTGSASRVKLETLKAKLTGGDQAAVAVLVSAEGKSARPAIDAFLSSLGDVDAFADAAVRTARGR